MAKEENLISEIKYYVREFHDYGDAFPEDTPTGLVDIHSLGNYEDDEKGVDEDLFGYRIVVAENLKDFLENDALLNEDGAYDFYAWVSASTRKVSIVCSYDDDWLCCLENIESFLRKYCEYELDE
jgi:hypothetical protein